MSDVGSRTKSRQSVDPDFFAVMQHLGEETSWESFASEQRAMLMTLEENALEQTRRAAEAADEAFAKELSATLNPPPQAARVVHAPHCPRFAAVAEANEEMTTEDENSSDTGSGFTRFTSDSDTRNGLDDDDRSTEHFSDDDHDSWNEDYENGDTFENLADLTARVGDVPRPVRVGNLDRLPTRLFQTPPRQSGQTTNPECVICLVNFRKNAVLRRLPCLHEFHSKCIDKWLLPHSRHSPPVCQP